ncbi:cytochrome P450 [Morchella snyderi]|nr:cytochrome P450 [Morchella snyderi]
MAYTTLLWTLFVLFLTYYFKPLIQNLLNYRANAKFAREHNCHPPKVHLTQKVFPFSVVDVYQFARAAASGRHINHFTSLFQLYGNTRVSSSPLFVGRTVVSIEPEIIKTILATNFADWELGNVRHDAFSDLLGDGIFTSDGKVWEHARAILRPQFVKDQISDIDDLETHFQDLLSILTAPGEGQVVELHKLFLSYTMDTSTSSLFGESVFALRGRGGDGEGESFQDDFDYAQLALGYRLVVRGYRVLYRPRRLPKAIKRIHDYVDEFVDRAIQRHRAEKKEKGKYVFLEELAQATQDRKVLRDQTLSVMIAGRDTTATLLSWVFWLVSKNPKVWEKLRQEVLYEVGKELPNYQQLKDCRYLKWVINEALRLYPVVPINFRFCNKNTTLPIGGGPSGDLPLFAPKGSCVVYSVYALHRRTDIYGADADEFRPERWGEMTPRAWEYLPFNGGPRICIGQQMALITASYTIVRMVQEFRAVEDADVARGQVLTNVGLTLSPANGTPVRLYRDVE